MKYHVRPSAASVAVCLLACTVSSSQTMLDLSSQARNIDFSRAASTRPFPVGTVLPPVCKTGQTFFKSNAESGKNLYLCVATNTWVVTTNGIDSLGTSAGVAALFSGSGTHLCADGKKCAGGGVLSVSGEGAGNDGAGNILLTLPARAVSTDVGGVAGAAAVYDLSASAQTNPLKVVANVGALPPTCDANKSMALVSGLPMPIRVCNSTGNGWISLGSSSSSPNLPTQFKGDLIVHDGAADIAQAVGSNGTVLEADSTRPTGLKWGVRLPLTTGTGIVVESSTGITTARAITGANGALVTNGSGVSGNPTIALPGTTKGDILAHDGAVVTKLSAGSNRAVLEVDDTQPTGLKWGSRLALTGGAGIVAETSTGVTTARSIIGSNGAVVTNGSGVSGNPTIGLPGTTKGDILAHDGAVVTKLSAGSNRAVLEVDNTQPTGLKWGSRLALTGGAGIVAETSTGVTTARSIIGSNGAVVTNGSGVSGNPTIGLPGTTKGDILAHDGAVVTKLSAGSNRAVLEVDNTQPTGLKWGSRLALTGGAGIVAETSPGVTTARSIIGSNGAVVTDGDAVGGNPTIALPGTTKGDVLVHNGTEVTRLPVGANGQSLVADSGATTGVKWASGNTGAYFYNVAYPITGAPLNATMSSVSNQPRARLTTAPITLTLGTVALTVSTAASGGKCYVGVWALDKTLLAQSAFIDTTSTGVKNVAFTTSPTLVAGMPYYIGGACDNTTVRISGMTNGTAPGMSGLLNSNGTVYAGASSNLVSGGVLPALGNITQNDLMDIPILLLFNN